MAAVPKVTKKTARNPGFWTSCTLFRLRICHRLPRVRGTQSLSCRMTYRLFVLRRCRSCNATVEDEALLDGAMRASRPTEFYRWSAVGRGRGVKKTCRWHVFSLRSRRLCRRSIHLVFEGTIVHRAGRRGRRPLRSLHRTPTTNCNIKGDNYHAYSGY